MTTPKTTETASSSTAAQQDVRGGIDLIESVMLKEEQVECSLVHHFGPGIYIREVSIPAGTFSVGHYQKHEHYNIMLKGRVMMFNPDNTRTELVAPTMFTAQPGRKVGFIIEDMVWQNIYATNETDIDILEETYISKSDHWKAVNEASDRVEHMAREDDRVDYANILNESGFTEETARSQSEDESDQIEMPAGCKPYRIAPSNIEGVGYFVTTPVEAGELIAIARLNGKRTPAGRYVNHSASPNAEMVRLESGDVSLVAISRIRGCLGGSLGEEVTISYREALKLSGVELQRRGKLCQQ